MSQELLTKLIAYAPTILFAIVVLFSTIRGAIRGFRKSTILFVHYIIAVAIATVCYIVLTKQAYTVDVSQAFANTGLGYNFSGCTTLADHVAVIAENLSENVGNLSNNQYFVAIVNGIASLAVNIACAIVCFIGIVFIVRLILRLIYMCVYSEHKHKKNIKAEGGKYRKHAFFGMLVGFVRGVVTVCVAWSLVFSLFSMMSGSVKVADSTTVSYTEASSNKKSVEYLIGNNDYAMGIYNGLLQMNDTGIMKYIDKANIGNFNVVYYYTDLVLSVKVPALNEDGSIKYNNAKLRKLLTEAFDVVYSVGESNVLMEDSTGKIVVNSEALTSEYLDSVIKLIDLKDYTDVIPVALTMMATAFNDGTIKVDDDIKNYFNQETIDSYKTIDIKNDIDKIQNVITDVLGIVEEADIIKNGSIDTSSFDYTKISTDSVKKLFNELSDITLLNKAIFPVATALSASMFADDLNKIGADLSDLDFANVNWKTEIAHFGNIYEKFYNLGLTQEELKSMNSETIKNKLDDSSFVDKAKLLVETTFDSELFSGFGLIAIKYSVSQINAKEGTETLVNALKTNLETYKSAELKEDISTLLESCNSLISLYSSYKDMDKSAGIFSIVNELDTTKLREVVLGTDDGAGNVTGGMYDLKLLKGCVGDMLEYALKTYAGSFFTEEDIANVSASATNKDAAWRSELSCVFDIIDVICEVNFSDFDKSDLTTVPTITDTQIDKLTTSLSSSKLMGNAISGLLYDAVSSVSSSIKDKDSYTWLDTETSRGEVNKLLKALMTFKENNGIDAVANGNTDGMIKCIADMSDKPEDIDRITDCNILMDVVSDTIVDTMETNLNTTIDADSIVWANQYEVVDGVKKLKSYGEFNKIARLLTISVLKDSDGKISINNLTDLSTIKTISTEDIDKITDSQLVVQCLNSIIATKLPSGFNVPTDINWANKYNDAKVLVEMGELQALIKVMNMDAIKFNSDGSIDASNISDVSYLATPTKFSDDNINTLSQSKIIMSGINSSISDSLSSIVTNLPEDIEWGNTLSGATVTKYGELQALVNVLRSCQTSLGEDLTTSNLFEAIIKLTDHSVVVDSVVIYSVASEKIADLETSSTFVVIPTAAKEDGKITKAEIVYMLDALKFANITSVDSLSVSNFSSALSDTNFRYALAKSSILSQTLVKNLIGQAVITVPDSLNSVTATGWYANYDFSNYKSALSTEAQVAIKASELDKLIVAINELGLSLADDISFDNSILTSINSTSSTDSALTKLNVIYASQVMQATLSQKIKDVITIPATYKKNSTTTIEVIDANGYIKEAEISKLFTALDKLDISFSSSNIDIDTATFTSKLVGNNDSIDAITDSAIISAEFAKTVSLVTSLVIPSNVKFTEDTLVYIYSDELNGLLKGMSALGVTSDLGSADYSNVSNIDSTKLNTALTNSKILHATLSDKIIASISTLSSKYYSNDTTMVDVITEVDSIKYVVVSEIVGLVYALNKINLTDFSATNSVSISSVAALGEDEYTKIVNEAHILDLILSISVLGSNPEATITGYNYIIVGKGGTGDLALTEVTLLDGTVKKVLSSETMIKLIKNMY